MRLLRRLLDRKEVEVPPLPHPDVPGFDRNQIEVLDAYDRELRMRALDLDIDVLAHRYRCRNQGK